MLLQFFVFCCRQRASGAREKTVLSIRRGEGQQSDIRKVTYRHRIVSRRTVEKEPRGMEWRRETAESLLEIRLRAVCLGAERAIYYSSM